MPHDSSLLHLAGRPLADLISLLVGAAPTMQNVVLSGRKPVATVKSRISVKEESRAAEEIERLLFRIAEWKGY